MPPTMNDMGGGGESKALNRIFISGLTLYTYRHKQVGFNADQYQLALERHDAAALKTRFTMCYVISGRI